jgi:hypothetical protein
MCVQGQALCHGRARGKARASFEETSFSTVMCMQGVRHALADVRHTLADERDLVAVNDHPDEVRDAAKKEKDKVELRGLALASKRRCSQTQREAKRAHHGSYG